MTFPTLIRRCCALPLFLGLAAVSQVSCTSYLPIVEVDESLFQDDWSFERGRISVGFKPGSPLRLSIEDAVLMALENNGDLRIRRLEPAIAGTFEQLERARFDPVLGAEIASSLERTERFPDELNAPISDRREGFNSSIGYAQTFPSGTDIELGLSHQYTDSDRVANAQHRVRAGVTLTQALLRGRGRAANLADLQQARLDVEASEFEFRAFAESLTADVELAYWDFVLAARELEIFESSLALAGRQRDATRERIELGQTAGVEITASEAEVALRRQALIDASANKEILRLRLIRLLNPGGGRISAWDTLLDTIDPPTIPQVQLDPASVHAGAARQWRPEIREAKLRLANRELEVVKTRNGLLPRLDFFVTLGKTGFADSFGRAASNIDGDGYDARLGLRAELPLGRRADNARHQHAELTREAAVRSIDNLIQIVELDVRAAYTEVARSRAQIDASAVTRELQEELLRTETEKLNADLSTALDVAQVQRDLLQAQIAEVRAVIDFRKSLVELYRMEGTLLARRGIGPPLPAAIP